MASHKRTILIFLLATAVAILAGVTRSNDLVLGSHLPGDFLMQRDPAKKSSSILQVVKMTKTFTGDNYHRITHIRFLDQNAKGNGARASVIAGGLNSTFVTAEFKSQKGHSIDFVVELYGK